MPLKIKYDCHFVANNNSNCKIIIYFSFFTHLVVTLNLKYLCIGAYNQDHGYIEEVCYLNINVSVHTLVQKGEGCVKWLFSAPCCIVIYNNHNMVHTMQHVVGHIHAFQTK